MKRPLLLVPVFLAAAAATLSGCPPADGCASDGDCSFDDVCVDGVCVECGDDDDCDADEVCDDGGCEPAGGEGEGEGEPDAGPGEGEGEQVCEGNRQVCDNDRVCPGGFCDKDGDGDGIPAFDDPLGCCVSLVCLGDGDCAAGEVCDVRRGLCLPEGLCDPSDPAACGGGSACLVEDGFPRCTDVVPQAASCEIVDDGAATGSGAPLLVRALGLLASGLPAPRATFTFTGAGVAPDGTVTSTCLGPAVCEVSVTATADAGGASCAGTVRVYPPVNAGDTRVVVVDQDTREPLAGVPVHALIAGTFSSAVTNADGSASFDGIATIITALPANHDWHTVVGPPADVLLPTRRTPDPVRVAGVKGQLDASGLSTIGDVTLGYAGVALPSLIDIDLERALGEPGRYNVDIEGLTEPGGQLVLMASPAVMSLGATPIKSDPVVLGSGRLAWSVAERIGLARIGPIVSTLTVSETPLGRSMGEAARTLTKPDHGLAAHDTVEGERPAAPIDGSPTPFAAWPFEEISFRPDTLASFADGLDVPPLPCRSGVGDFVGCDPASDMVVMRAAFVPGRGWVPLGFTSGSDSREGAPDGILDDPLLLPRAPAHSGLEGAHEVSMAVAINLDDVVDTSSRVGVRVSTFTGTTIPSFLASPDACSFVPGAATGGFICGGDAVADLFRVTTDDGAGGRWHVWAAAVPDFNFTELHDGTADVDARTTHARVESFTLGARAFPAPADADELFALDGVNLDRLDLYVDDLASEPCRAASAHCNGP